MVKFQVPESVEMVQLLLAGIHSSPLGFTPGDLDAGSQFLPGGRGVWGDDEDHGVGLGGVGWGELWQSHSLLKSGQSQHYGHIVIKSKGQPPGFKTNAWIEMQEPHWASVSSSINGIITYIWSKRNNV